MPQVLAAGVIGLRCAGLEVIPELKWRPSFGRLLVLKIGSEVLAHSLVISGRPDDLGRDWSNPPAAPTSNIHFGI